MGNGIRLLVFDVDGTLTGPGEPVRRGVAEKLRGLEACGFRIALASGKNASYLFGISRGMGLKRPLIIGENGCVIFDPVEKKDFWMGERSPEISLIEGKIRARFGDSVWIQPNAVALTVFSRIRGMMPEIIAFSRGAIAPYRERVVVFEHPDALDVLPCGVDKGQALTEVRRQYGFTKDETAAAGDAVNDIPMFKEAALQLIIGERISYPGALRFSTVEEALDYIDCHLRQG